MDSSAIELDEDPEGSACCPCAGPLRHDNARLRASLREITFALREAQPWLTVTKYGRAKGSVAHAIAVAEKAERICNV